MLPFWVADQALVAMGVLLTLVATVTSVVSTLFAHRVG